MWPMINDALQSEVICLMSYIYHNEITKRHIFSHALVRLSVVCASIYMNFI